MSKEIYSFTLEQLAIVLRGVIGIANKFYEQGKSDEEVFKMAVASQIRGLMIERELVNRGTIAKAEFQIYERDSNNKEGVYS